MGVLSFLFGIIVYVFASYVVFRLVSKFDPGVSFVQAMIPIWNWYLMVRVAVNNPVTYFWLTVLIPIALGVVFGAFSEQLASLLANLAIAVMTARVVGLIAQKLGKDFWLYAVMAVIPIVSFVAMMVLAFGDSRPVQSQ